MATGLLVLLGVASYMVGISSMSYQPAEIESLEKRGVTNAPPVSMALQGRKYVVEATFVFDKQALKKYKGSRSSVKASAKKDLDIMLGNINFMFDSLNLNMKIGLLSVEYLDRDISTSTTSGKVLKDFAELYVKKYQTSGGLRPDIAILLTGHAMDSGITKGIAYIGTACMGPWGWNSGVVSLTSSYYPIISAGHEIGHILGCQHDTEKGYIMGDEAGTTEWMSFSAASRKYISDYIAAMDNGKPGKPANCLKGKRQQTVIPGIFDQCQNSPGHSCGAAKFWLKLTSKCQNCRKGCHECSTKNNINLSR